MIEIRDLEAGYPDKQVLKSVNLRIEKGKITVILGPNGCGKSTLLKTIVGILPVQSGSVFFDGTDAAGLSSRQRAQKAAYLSQNRSVPDITVERMVLHGRFPYLSYPRRYQKRDLEIAGKAMERMGIRELADRSLSSLSGGQRQKVYIAMALAQDTPVILLDEPTTYLDVSHQIQMMKHAGFLCREGKTVVMVLHDIPMAMQTADKIILMRDGEVCIQGNPEDVYQSGWMNHVFGVDVRRTETPFGWQYYCREKEG